jgi:hypothetical protein
VPEQRLDIYELGAGVQQPRGMRVPELVGRDLASSARQAGPLHGPNFLVESGAFKSPAKVNCALALRPGVLPPGSFANTQVVFGPIAQP